MGIAGNSGNGWELVGNPTSAQANPEPGEASVQSALADAHSRSDERVIPIVLGAQPKHALSCRRETSWRVPLAGLTTGLRFRPEGPTESLVRFSTGVCSCTVRQFRAGSDPGSLLRRAAHHAEGRTLRETAFLPAEAGQLQDEVDSSEAIRGRD